MLQRPRQDREEQDAYLGKMVEVWGGRFDMHQEFRGNVGYVAGQVGNGLDVRRNYYYVRGLDPTNPRKTFQVYVGQMKIVEEDHA